MYTKFWTLLCNRRLDMDCGMHCTNWRPGKTSHVPTTSTTHWDGCNCRFLPPLAFSNVLFAAQNSTIIVRIMCNVKCRTYSLIVCSLGLAILFTINFVVDSARPRILRGFLTKISFWLMVAVLLCLCFLWKFSSL